MPKNKSFCPIGKKFPTFPVILLVVGIVWLLNDLNIFSVDIPWIPVVIIIVALGMIFNRLCESN